MAGKETLWTQSKGNPLHASVGQCRALPMERVTFDLLGEFSAALVVLKGTETYVTLEPYEGKHST